MVLLVVYLFWAALLVLGGLYLVAWTRERPPVDVVATASAVRLSHHSGRSDTAQGTVEVDAKTQTVSLSGAVSSPFVLALPVARGECLTVAAALNSSCSENRLEYELTPPFDIIFEVTRPMNITASAVTFYRFGMEWDGERDQVSYTIDTSSQTPVSLWAKFPPLGSFVTISRLGDEVATISLTGLQQAKTRADSLEIILVPPSEAEESEAADLTGGNSEEESLEASLSFQSGQRVSGSFEAQEVKYGDFVGRVRFGSHVESVGDATELVLIGGEPSSIATVGDIEVAGADVVAQGRVVEVDTLTQGELVPTRLERSTAWVVIGGTAYATLFVSAAWHIQKQFLDGLVVWLRKRQDALERQGEAGDGG